VDKYDDLLEEAKSKAAVYISTAKRYIPKMYDALMKENQNISPEDARDRIEKDCVGIWSKRTILDALPDEAKNREKQKSGRLGQKKRNFAAVSAAPELGTPAIIIGTNGRPINGAIDELSEYGRQVKAKTKDCPNCQDDYLEFKLSVPFVPLLGHMLRTFESNQDMDRASLVHYVGKLNVQTRKVVDVRWFYTQSDVRI